MSFEKECSITMMIVATICLVCCGIMAYRNHQLKNEALELRMQLEQVKQFEEQYNVRYEYATE